MIEPREQYEARRAEIRAREDALTYAFAFVCGCAIVCAVLVMVFR